MKRKETKLTMPLIGNANPNPPPSPPQTQARFCNEKVVRERDGWGEKRSVIHIRTLDLDVSGRLGRPDSSSGPPSKEPPLPLPPPPLTEVAPLHESGVVGLALGACLLAWTTTALERRCRTLHSSDKAGFDVGPGGGGGGVRCLTCLSPTRSSATTASSTVATLTHSSSPILSSLFRDFLLYLSGLNIY